MNQTPRIMARGPLFLLALSLWGCAPVYYAPNTHNVPLMTRRGEGRAALYAGDHRGEIQAAYAADNGLGLMLNGAYVKEKDDKDGDGGSGKFAELGAGYFTRVRDYFVFETYGLMGYGDFGNHFPSTLDAHPGSTGRITGRFARYGVQPAFGFTSRYLDAAVSVRAVGVRYFNIEGGLVFDNRDQVDYLEDRRSQFMLEPALTIRAGYDFLKLQFQTGTSRNLGDARFRQEKGYWTAGVLYPWGG
ncbi:MAG: hypothetical protein EPN93_14200 [Spirochaetes bacterium]|nr:MAG: hypothetical protein EPN93_14200 [Spirochaetota bacterium]